MIKRILDSDRTLKVHCSRKNGDPSCEVSIEGKGVKDSSVNKLGGSTCAKVGIQTASDFVLYREFPLDPGMTVSANIHKAVPRASKVIDSA